VTLREPADYSVSNRKNLTRDDDDVMTSLTFLYNTKCSCWNIIWWCPTTWHFNNTTIHNLDHSMLWRWSSVTETRVWRQVPLLTNRLFWMINIYQVPSELYVHGKSHVCCVVIHGYTKLRH